MNQQVKDLTVLFADITDSTGLYERVGDEKARKMIAESLSRLSEITAKSKGKVIKTMGDGMMATFPSANDAFGAAVEMQEAQKMQPLSITVGFHHGQVIEENNDVFGDTVNLASRVAGKAKSGEILLTEETVNFLVSPYKMATRFLDKTTVKGKAETVNIFSVITEGDEEATVSLSSSLRTNKESIANKELKLNLSVMGHSFDVTGSNKVIIGREEGCDIAIQAPYASRKHAMISKQRDVFILSDQSTNGTYVKPDSGEEVFIKREAVSLVGSGLIALGEKTDSGSSFIIKYKAYIV